MYGLVSMAASLVMFALNDVTAEGQLHAWCVYAPCMSYVSTVSDISGIENT